MSKKEYEAIEIVEEKEYYEASSAQKRMYMLQGFNNDSIAYNMPAFLEILGKLEIERVNESFIKLIKRHEDLRTCFYAKGDIVVQKIHKAEEIKFQVNEIKVVNEAEVATKIKEFMEPFNLEKAPLLRVSVLTLEKERHIMLVDMHHIISDGTSMAILTKEFSEIYAGMELQKLNVQYKDYSAWQLKKEK